MIKAIAEKCTGCGRCELACSFHHEHVFSPELSRIRMYRDNISGQVELTFCDDCDECGICVEHCFFDALEEI